MPPRRPTAAADKAPGESTCAQQMDAKRPRTTRSPKAVNTLDNQKRLFPKEAGKSMEGAPTTPQCTTPSATCYHDGLTQDIEEILESPMAIGSTGNEDDKKQADHALA